MKKTRILLTLFWLVVLVIAGGYYTLSNKVGTTGFGIGLLLFSAAMIIANTEE